MENQIIDYLYNHFWLVPVIGFIFGWSFFRILGKIITFVEHFNETERGNSILFNILMVVIVTLPTSVITFIIYKLCQELLFM